MVGRIAKHFMRIQNNGKDAYWRDAVSTSIREQGGHPS